MGVFYLERKSMSISREDARKKLENLEAGSGTQQSSIDPLRLMPKGKASQTRPKPTISQLDGDPE